MSRVGRRLAVVSVATLAITLSPVARAEEGGIRNYLPIAIEDDEPQTVVVDDGDHLWSISADYLEQDLMRVPTDSEIALFWRDVIEANRNRLRSGNPDLIYPGETVVLPGAG
jgi:nucleoid-associated protein YgaU